MPQQQQQQLRSSVVAAAKRNLRRDDDSEDPLASDAPAGPAQPTADAGGWRLPGLQPPAVVGTVSIRCAVVGTENRNCSCWRRDQKVPAGAQDGGAQDGRVLDCCLQPQHNLSTIQQNANLKKKVLVHAQASFTPLVKQASLPW